jgi:putative restriction endonuclease
LETVASHCKPWRDATNEERLDGENGLLLTRSIDHLFDRGGIGFKNNGALMISSIAHRPSPQRMGIDITEALNVGVFTSGQKQFLDFHRNAVLLQSIRG